MDDFEEQHQGTSFKVVHCKGARKSFDDAMSRLQPPKKKLSITKTLVAWIGRLANGGKPSGENFPREGKLPNGTYFRAFKKIPIRAYVWLSSAYPDTYFISHYVYKKSQKLKSTDTERVCSNWRRIEEDGHER